MIGILHGIKNSMTGIIDVATIGSLYSKGRFNEFINSYGMVIMDECHHAASATAVEVLQKINARYVYGVSATPQRSDNLEKIIFMLLGDDRHKFTAGERAIEQGIGHYVYPRYTNVVDIDDELVWHGGMNLLGKADIWDNLMRIKSARVAAELMEIAFD